MEVGATSYENLFTYGKNGHNVFDEELVLLVPYCQYR